MIVVVYQILVTGEEVFCRRIAVIRAEDRNDFIVGKPTREGLCRVVMDNDIGIDEPEKLSLRRLGGLVPRTAGAEAAT